MGASKIRRLFCLLLFCIFSLSRIGAETPPKLTGTFSSFEFHQESGDLSGIEVRLIRVRSGIKGVVQFAEGGAGDVLLADVSTTGNGVLFSSPDGFQPTFKFEGQVSQKGLSGKISYGTGASERVFLKRQPSYWDR